MPQPSSILRKIASNSPPSNISGETSFAPRVLLDRVKPIWADAQGDSGELSVDRVGPLLTGFCWLRFDPKMAISDLALYYCGFNPPL